MDVHLQSRANSTTKSQHNKSFRFAVEMSDAQQTKKAKKGNLNPQEIETLWKTHTPDGDSTQWYNKSSKFFIFFCFFKDRQIKSKKIVFFSLDSVLLE